MTLSLTDINVGTVADDGTGDTARVAGQTINANNGLIETEVNAFYTSLDTGQLYCDNLEIQNGGQVAAQAAALGLVFSGGPDAPAELRCYDTGHATLAQDWLLVSNSALTLHYDHSAAQIDSYKDFHINSGSVLEVDTINEVTATNGVVVDSVTLKDGGVQGAGGILLTERADHQNTPGATKGELWVRSDTPNVLVFTDDAGTDWDLNTAGGAGDFLANGSVDMTGEFRTDVGTMDSDVADGATANAWDFDCANTLSTAGANVFRMRNAGTPVFDFSFQGGIDHVNSGASTAAHSQSLNLNWSSGTTKTSSGQYSAVVGANCTASAQYSVAVGSGCTSSEVKAFSGGSLCTASGDSSFAYGATCTASDKWAVCFGANGVSTHRAGMVLGTYRFAANGDAQSEWVNVSAATADATQTTLTANGTNLVIPADTTWAFSALVVARSDETDGNLSMVWKLEGCLTRDESNNTALVGSVTKTVIADGAAGAWDVTAEADDTNEALAIKATGEAATNIRWVAKVDIAQVTYA